ncbi:flagellar biosynthesis protein FlhA [Patulibacter minatonensis]|uniref:flagellar biosynthesis protein FlhA n=1 Tax=Patulibacter minatonensis TaxID=298163 RepID=UPI00047CB50C|nr:flagellar biosynthesis protein FlhA [Patulibacter minatonensis]
MSTVATPPTAGPDGAITRIMRHSDLLAAVGIMVVVAMLIVPLPPALLDLFITINIAGAIAVVVATLYLKRALDLSVFPSLLLLSTIFRLAINVSVTRLVLSEGEAGSVVHAFGEFVIGGNLVVGLVVFLILVVIQFVVVTNGAGRVAEVAARFTLDAMPGKQMAIDADLNSGQITEDQARTRRAEIAQEADFYGAMDGASKFVKGDAIAAIIITLINLVGGLAIGVLMNKMSFGDAAHHYSLLTIGDGLAAQVPALLISVATGIIVTRAASDGDLGSDLARQVLGQDKAPLVAGGLVLAFAMIPGLPKVPFVLVGGGLVAVGLALRKRRAGQAEEAETQRLALEATDVPQLPAGAEIGVEALAPDPLELAIGYGLVTLVDRPGGTLLQRISHVRRQLATELGVIVPPVRVHDEPGLEPNGYVVRMRGGEVARGRLLAGHHLAMDPGDAAGELAGVPTTEPAFGLPAVWVAEGARAEAEALGYTVVDGESVVVTHLTEQIRRHAGELLTRQAVRGLVDGLKEHNAAAVEEVVGDALTLGELQRVLQRLLAEGVSVRDLGTIVEAIGDRARLTRDPDLLAEHARQALSRQITAPHLDAAQRMSALALDPGVEQEVAGALVQTPEGEVLALDPARAQRIVVALKDDVDRAARRGVHPVLLCSSRVRRHLRRLVEQALPALPVCSYNEIGPGIDIETVGVIQP